jgi:hypothetical protein
MNGSYQLVDFTGRALSSPYPTKFYEVEQGQLLVELPMGQRRKVMNSITMSVIYEIPRNYSFRYNDGSFTIKDTVANKFGFMNTAGVVIVPPIYDYGPKFSY